MNTPILQSINLAGDRVRDLIAALSLLDPDTRTDVTRVKATDDKLVLENDGKDAFIESINDETGQDFTSLRSISNWIVDAMQEQEILDKVREALK